MDIPNRLYARTNNARVFLVRMKSDEVARELAQQNRLSRAQARDQVDEAVRNILRALREGRPVKFPGLGRLVSKPAKPKAGSQG
jgi:nucleoid DNA-binding protein